MKFLLHEGLGYSTIQLIGDYLRLHGSGHHWIEKYRGDIFIHTPDEGDELLLRTNFADLLDPIEIQPPVSGTG